MSPVAKVLVTVYCTKNLLLCYLLNAGPFVPFQQPWVEVKRATCREAVVHWWHDDPVCPLYWLIMLTRTSDDACATCFFYVDGKTTQLYVPLLLTAGCEYKVSVAAMARAFHDTHLPNFLVFDEGAMDFRAGV